MPLFLRIRVALTLAGMAAALSACGPGVECTRDTDCNGTRVCAAGACTEPSPFNGFGGGLSAGSGGGGVGGGVSGGGSAGGVAGGNSAGGVAGGTSGGGVSGGASGGGVSGGSSAGGVAGGTSGGGVAGGTSSGGTSGGGVAGGTSGGGMSCGSTGDLCLRPQDCCSGACNANTFECEVMGGNCSRASPLSFVDGVATVSGSTAGARDTGRGTCLGSGGKDLAWRFTTTTTQTFRASVTPGTLNDPAVYLRAGDCDAITDVACDTSSGLSVSDFRVVALPPGTYYLFVDSTNGNAGGTFTLRATLSSADTCVTAKALTFSSGAATEPGSTGPAFDDFAGACGGNGSPDVVYTFSAPTSSTPFSATVVPLASFARPVVYVRSSCAATQNLVCGAAAPSSAVTVVADTGVGFGPQQVVVDGVGASDFGGFTLKTLFGAAANGANCNAPHPLVLSGGTSGSATVYSTNVGMFNDSTGSCGGLGVDQVYQFTITSTRTFTASIAPGVGHWPYLYLRRGSACATATEVAGTCVSSNALGQPIGIPATTLTAGTYFLWVDGFTNTQGSYKLQVSVQ